MFYIDTSFMKKKGLLIVVFVVLFQTFVPSFLYVEASNGDTKQPEACSWPTEMMSNYFNFQSEAISILLWSKVNERTLEVSLSNRGLFSQKVLSLSAIDLVASSFVTKVRSSFSNLLTSAVLILLVSASVVQSNVEWLAILYKDRPVVRDYKEMLDIETQLFDVAYFRSKQINLTRPLEWDMSTKLKKLIKEYQEIWLLDNGKELESNSSMVDVLLGLLSMNAAMKHFVMAGGNLWKSGLSSYNWCLWFFGVGEKCNEKTAVLKFNGEAITQLDEDYKKVRSFSACNSYANFFMNGIDNAVSSSKDSLNTSVQDVKDSMNRLWGALIGKNGTWNLIKGPCDGISDYEMAQLRAYRWSDWKCWEWINVSSVVSSVSSAYEKVKEYYNEKVAQRKQEDKIDDAASNVTKRGFNKYFSKGLTGSELEKKEKRYEMYLNGSEFNPAFSYELNSGFNNIFEETMDWYWQSLKSAIASDNSNFLPKGKWILDQIDTTMKNTKDLESVLQKIVGKQCSG